MFSQRTIELLRKYSLGDWIVAACFAIVYAIIHVFRPNHRSIDSNDVSLQHGVESSQVPLSLLFVLSALVPLMVFFGVFLLRKSRENLESFEREQLGLDLAYSLLGLALNLLFTLVATEFLKKLVGRPRPNSIALSGWDGTSFNAARSDVDEAFQSFPSGHSSFAWSGLSYLALWIWNMLFVKRAPHSGNQAWKLFLATLPLFLAGWVAATRVQDYWHFPSDVLAGAVLGSSCASVWFGYAKSARGRRNIPAATNSFRLEEDSKFSSIPV